MPTTMMDLFSHWPRVLLKYLCHRIWSSATRCVSSSCFLLMFRARTVSISYKYRLYFTDTLVVCACDAPSATEFGSVSPPFGKRWIPFQFWLLSALLAPFFPGLSQLLPSIPLPPKHNSSAPVILNEFPFGTLALPVGE